MVHWLALLFQRDCGFPKFPVAIMVPQNLFMLALFGDFYYKTYVKDKSKAKKDDDHKRRNGDDDDNPASNQKLHTASNNGISKPIANGNGTAYKANNLNNLNNSNNHQSHNYSASNNKAKVNGISSSLAQ